MINLLYKKNYILIYTSRFMGRNNDNVKLAEKEGYFFTYNQLKKWKLNFHELKLGKPSYDVFIDDKSFNFKKNWLNNFKAKFKKNFQLKIKTNLVILNNLIIDNEYTL